MHSFVQTISDLLKFGSEAWLLKQVLLQRPLDSLKENKSYLGKQSNVIIIWLEKSLQIGSYQHQPHHKQL